MNPAAVYCLLVIKTKYLYDRMLIEIIRLVLSCPPWIILTDIETAAMSSYREAFPSATIKGCYFHLCQSVLRKVNELGMKVDYESNDDLRIAVRCLAALARVPLANVSEAFDLIVVSMPRQEKMDELLSYFENAYIRCKRVRGKGGKLCSCTVPDTYMEQVSIGHRRNSSEYQCRTGLALWSPVSFYMQPSNDVDTALSRRRSNFKRRPEWSIILPKNTGN
ncbi:hypothetical protein RF11_11660 [Thelohanellus kitauei]|uniref:MULE transposase domain-containing protein n=1 Tax=Thelohanellus kitauei TaxID=669202 RepID=A0A0C2MEN6_THEKT|nr:hypothetical protein RF11_11660 [Thelohanellus kitauei]